jgi:Flp pilus assembly protein TadG
MRNLVRPLLRLLGRDDRGAIGVLVAVLIGGGVLLGMAALVVDVGQIYQNRAELQSGADAAALAVARQCALTQGSCAEAGAQSTAVTYASANASKLTQNTAGVSAVCGTDGLTSPCSPGVAGSGLTNCPPDPTTGVNFVDVQTETALKNGSTLLPPVFAQTLVGNSSYTGTTVKACAQAEWGTAEQSNSLALTISMCDWQQLTNGGFNTPVPVYIKGKDKACAGPAGQNVPGGFDWLQPTNTNACTASIDLTTDTTYNNTGNNISQPCKIALVTDVDAYLAGKPVTVFLPVFGCPNPPVPGCPVTGTGTNATYYVIWLAGFVITGYANMPGMDQVGAPNNLGLNSACQGNAPCIQGYFLPGLDPVADVLNPNPSPFQVMGIKLTG